MSPPTRIMTLNGNGIRSIAKKGFFTWFLERRVDILCLQETKSQLEQIESADFHPAGYHRVFQDAATKKGYSGVAIYSKSKPDSVIREIGIPELDREGRYIEARFGSLSVASIYLPSGSSAEARQAFKLEMLAILEPIFLAFQKSDRSYVLTGDFNIVHTALDIKNFKQNQKTSGCTPEERAFIDRLVVEQAWIDTYRHLRPEGQDYTWWSNRGSARQNDVGWRIDYQLASRNLQKALVGCGIDREPRFSDHAPYWVDYQLQASA